MENDWALVLLGRFPGKDRVIAHSLARAFEQGEAWGMQIVGATPINLLTGLSQAQGEEVHRALAPIEELGCRFQVRRGADPSCPSIHWAAPPKINGISLTEYSAAQTAPAEADLRPMVGTAQTVIPCPHCGQPIQLSFGPAGGLPQEAPQTKTPVGLPATLQPVPPAEAAAAMAAPQPALRPPSGGAPAVGQVPAFGAPRALASPTVRLSPRPHPTPKSPAPIQLPAPIPFPSAAAPQPRPVAGPRPAPIPQPLPAPQPMPVQNDDMEELAPISDFSPGAAAQAPMPLPEVPVLGVDMLPPATTAPSPGKGVSDLRGPMDMSDFEAGLNLPPGQFASATPAVPVQPAPVQRRESGPARIVPPAANPDAICSLFIGKTGNPRVHELIAEIQGIPVEEAEKLCRKFVVPIVKDIPVREAEPIRQRFLQLGMTPRLAIKR